MNTEISPVHLWIITPMTALYHPPAQSRDKPEALKAIYAAYHTVLRKFSADALKKGWEDIIAVKKTWTFPSPAEIAEACTAYQPKVYSDDSRGAGELPWEKTMRLARERTKRFEDDFMQTALYHQALMEGWEWQLRCCIANIALAQAQLIEGRTHTGIPHEFMLYSENEQQREEWVRDLIFSAKGAARVSINLPYEMIEAIKCHATFGKISASTRHADLPHSVSREKKTEEAFNAIVSQGMSDAEIRRMKQLSYRNNRNQTHTNELRG